jgi:hypothetical protein
MLIDLVIGYLELSALKNGSLESSKAQSAAARVSGKPFLRRFANG